MKGWLNASLKSTDKNYVKMPVSTWCYITTSLPPEPSSIFSIESWIQALDTKRPVASLAKGDLLGICHLLFSASVVLFQLHGGMVSHMQVLATPSSTVHNTKYLDPYHWKHISFSCSACMRERVTVVTLSVCLSVCVPLFDFGEGAVFRVETYISTF